MNFLLPHLWWPSVERNSLILNHCSSCTENSWGSKFGYSSILFHFVHVTYEKHAQLSVCDPLHGTIWPRTILHLLFLTPIFWYHIYSRSTSSHLLTVKDTTWIIWNRKAQCRRCGNQKGTGKGLHHNCCEREAFRWQEWSAFFAQLNCFQKRCSLTCKCYILLLLIVHIKNNLLRGVALCENGKNFKETWGDFGISSVCLCQKI